jgi:hypothetical protein
MSRENPLWGVPKIHGELLKLGIEIGETSVSKYMTPQETAIADLEGTPREPCEEHGVGRLLRCADDPVPDPVRVFGAGARTTADHSLRGHG